MIDKRAAPTALREQSWHAWQVRVKPRNTQHRDARPKSMYEVSTPILGATHDSTMCPPQPYEPGAPNAGRWVSHGKQFHCGEHLGRQKPVQKNPFVVQIEHSPWKSKQDRKLLEVEPLPLDRGAILRIVPKLPFKASATQKKGTLAPPSVMVHR